MTPDVRPSAGRSVVDGIVAAVLIINVLAVPLTLLQLWRRGQRKGMLGGQPPAGVPQTPLGWYVYQLLGTFGMESGAFTVEMAQHPSPYWSLGVLLALLSRLVLLTFNLALEQGV